MHHLWIFSDFSQENFYFFEGVYVRKTNFRWPNKPIEKLFTLLSKFATIHLHQCMISEIFIDFKRKKWSPPSPPHLPPPGRGRLWDFLAFFFPRNSLKPLTHSLGKAVFFSGLEKKRLFYSLTRFSPKMSKKQTIPGKKNNTVPLKSKSSNFNVQKLKSWN